MFIGRLDELRKLHTYVVGLKNDPAVISGPPGIGKSALVRQYLRQYQRDVTTLWINSENDITIVDSFWRHQPEPNRKKERIRKEKFEKIRDLIDKVCDGRCGFLVFDGTDCIDAIRAYLPGKSSQLKILITTRYEDVEPVLMLQGFSDRDAKDFVQSAFGKSSAEHNSQIENLIGTFQGHPFGLCLATSLIISAKERPLSENIREYIGQHNKNAILYPKDIISSACMEISFKNLKEQQNCACQILEILAYCCSENIPINLFLPLAESKDNLSLAINVLRQFNFITAISKDTINISRQIQKFVRQKHSENKKKNILRVVLKMFGSCPSAQLYVHCATVWSFALHHSDLVQEFHCIPGTVIRVLMHATRWLEAEQFGRQVVMDLTAALGEKHLSTVRMVYDCAEIAFHQEKTDKALVGFKSVLDERTFQLGSDHKETIRVWERLFETLANRNEWIELVTMCRDELNRSIRVNGTDHQYTMDLRSKLNWILRDKEIHLDIMDEISELRVQARYDEAIERCEVFINIFSPELHYKNKAAAMQCLAKLYYLKGDYERALQYNEALVNDILTALGADHKDILRPKRYIAVILQEKKDLEAASSKYIEVLKDCQRIVGPDHPENQMIFRGQASLLRVAGKVEDSLLAYQNTLDRGELALGHDHPENLITKRCVAAVYQKLGCYETALNIYKEILTKSNDVLGINHVDHLITTRAMAAAFHQAGKTEKAWKLFEKVLRRGEKLLGAGHPDNALTRRAMAEAKAELYSASSETSETTASSRTASKISESETVSYPENRQEQLQTKSSAPAPDFGAALKAYHNVLEHEKITSTTDQSTDLITKCCIAAVMQEQGEYEAALKVYQEVFDRRVAVLGHDHPDNLITRRAMAAVLQKQGKYDEAIRAYREILERGVKVLGADHEDNSETKRNIVAVQRQKTKFKNFLAAFHAERRRASKFNTGFVAMLLLLVLAVVLYAKEVYV